MALLCMFGVLMTFQAGSAPAPQVFDYALVIAQIPHRTGHHTVSPGKFIFDHNLRPDGGRIILRLSQRGSQDFNSRICLGCRSFSLL